MLAAQLGSQPLQTSCPPKSVCVFSNSIIDNIMNVKYRNVLKDLIYLLPRSEQLCRCNEASNRIPL